MKLSEYIEAMQAVGTSAGVEEAWMTRHGEAGQFVPTTTPNVYSSPSGTQVQVQESQNPAPNVPTTPGPPVQMMVHEIAPTGQRSTFMGSHKQGHAMMKARYNIVHTSANWSGKGWRHSKNVLKKGKFGVSSPARGKKKG